MSDWRGHLRTGFVWQTIMLILVIGLSIYFKQIPTLKTIIILPLIFVLSPLISDIDHPSSKITKFFLLIGILSLWYALLVDNYMFIYIITFLTFVVLVSQFINHRGITHNFLFILMLHIIVIFVLGFSYLILISFVGVMSHLHADKMLFK